MFSVIGDYAAKESRSERPRNSAWGSGLYLSEHDLECGGLRLVVPHLGRGVLGGVLGVV